LPARNLYGVGFAPFKKEGRIIDVASGFKQFEVLQ
jgi:hypothetical protein